MFPNGTLYINSLRKETTYTCFAETYDATNGKLIASDDRSANVRIASEFPHRKMNLKMNCNELIIEFTVSSIIYYGQKEANELLESTAIFVAQFALKNYIYIKL